MIYRLMIQFIDWRVLNLRQAPTARPNT